MPRYSRRSLAQLRTVVAPLQEVFEFVIKHFDNTILEGHRGKVAQNRAADAGHSKLRYPNGKHNKYPSEAVDAGPYDPETRGVNWDTKVVQGGKLRRAGLYNLLRFYYFAGWVMGVAAAKGVKLRWGGDWDRDTDLDDQRFNDLVHFEYKGRL